MADDELNFANEVSEFIHRSCPRRQTFRYAVMHHFRGSSYPVHHPVSRIKCKRIPVNTGSAAELYIDPMLSCVGDFDVMYHHSNEIAVPKGHPPPEHLPTDFDRRVEVFEIVDSHLPGYVYLALAYVLLKSTVDGKYKIECVKQPNTFLNNDLYITKLLSDATETDCAEIHGPACKREYECVLLNPVHVDTVPCIRCLEWPPQAADWLSRHRNWPDATTVDVVVSTSCDVVGVAHPLCKYDTWIGKHQWRLSFSRAEVKLLNSLTLEQQIVYHMLRTFVKTERLTDNSNKCGVEKFSNYHVKMTMLWACELNSQNWWRCGSSLVGVCVKLMHFLNEWLTKWHGQHYFISNVHFSDYFDTLDIDTLSAIVKSVTEHSLAQWFVDNYMRKCAELCPENISLLCSDVVTKRILRDTAIAVMKWSDHISCQSMMKEFMSPILVICSKQPIAADAVSMSQFLVSLFFSMAVGLKTVAGAWFSSHNMENYFHNFIFFFNYFNDVMFSHLSEHGLLRDVSVDFITLFRLFMKCCPADGRRMILQCNSNSSSSVLAFMKAMTFMKFDEEKHRDISELMPIELSKAYLLRALRCKDSDSDSIYCLANVYLAVLYYITGQYQAAIDHCTLVTRLQDHSQCSSQVVQGELLPKIDDDVDIVLGLVVLYENVRSAALLRQRRPKEHAGVFTTELFAHYFVTKRLLVTKYHLSTNSTVSVANNTPHIVWEQLKAYRNRLVEAKNLFVSDLLLCKLPNKSHMLDHTTRTRNMYPRTASEVVKLLMRFSTEYVMNLMQLWPLVGLLDRPVAVSSITEFLPLYLYRCGLYDRCLEVCQENVRDLINSKTQDGQKLRLSTTHHELIQLMDNRIVSLVGVAVLASKAAGSKMKFTGPITVGQLALSLYLLTQSQIRLYYSSTNTSRQAVTASLAGILDWIADAEKIVPANSFDPLILKLTERNAVTCITTVLKDNTYRTRNAVFRLVQGLIASVQDTVRRRRH